jgi:hypothetical protein
MQNGFPNHTCTLTRITTTHYYHNIIKLDNQNIIHKLLVKIQHTSKERHKIYKPSPTFTTSKNINNRM